MGRVAESLVALVKGSPLSDTPYPKDPMCVISEDTRDSTQLGMQDVSQDQADVSARSPARHGGRAMPVAEAAWNYRDTVRGLGKRQPASGPAAVTSR